MTAVVGSGAAALLRWLLGEATGPDLPPYLTFYLVVLASGLLGGTGAGLAASFLSAALATILFLTPDRSLSTFTLSDRVGLLLFCVVNVCVSLVSGALRKARKQKQADITELRRVQSSLRESEERLRATFDEAAMGIVEVSAQDRFVAVNKRAGQILGYRCEDMLGMSVLQLTHPEDRPLTAELNAALHEGRKNQFDYEKRYVKADGTPVWVHVTVSAIRDADGRWMRSIGTIEDISQRKASQVRLETEKAFSDTAINSLPGIFVLFDDHQRLVRWNDSLLEVTGYSAQEILSMRALDFITQEDRALAAERIAQTIARGQAAAELRMRTRSGQDIPYRFTGRRFVFEGTTGVVAMGLDISEEQRTAEVLHRNAEQSRILSEALVHLLSTEDPKLLVRELFLKVASHLRVDTCFNYMVNEKEHALELDSYAGIGEETAATIRRLEFGQALCGTAAGSRTALVANDLQNSADEKAALLRSLGIQSYVCHPLMSGGRLLGTLSFASRTRIQFEDSDLEFLRLISNYVAIALDRARTGQALRESESFYRQTLESIPGMVFTTRADGYCDYQSQQWMDFTGVPMNEHLGDGWQALLHPADRQQAYDAWRAAVEERAGYDVEYRVRRYDGVYRWFKVRGQPIRNAEGGIVRWFGVALDIDDLKRAETALKEAGHRLALANAELEQKVNERTASLQETVSELEHFSYTITHDMRAPLRAMQGLGSILVEECGECLQTSRREYLRRIVDAAERMDRLITDALQYSGMVRQEFRLETVDTNALLEGILKTYPQFQSQHAEIAIHGELPLVVGNKAALTQIFSNLIGNALKFVLPGKAPRVRIWAEQIDSPADKRGSTPWVRLWVEDEGIGVDPEYQDKIWGMFQKLNKSYEGTGIGLALVRKAVQRIGGRVGVQSKVGEGSRFWVELPAATAAREHEDTALRRG
jgi:PAS domain S-box-containing protein